MTLKNVLGDIALEATLKAVRDRLPSALDSLGRLKVATNNAAGDLVDAGMLYSSGGEATTGTLNEHAHALITNPAGSAKRIYILSWSVHTSITAGAPVRYRIDATSTASTQTADTHSHMAGAPAAVAVVRCGPGALTDGVVMSAVHRAARDAPLDKAVPIRIDPGRSLGFVWSPGALDSTVAFGVAWREVSV